MLNTLILLTTFCGTSVKAETKQEPTRTSDSINQAYEALSPAIQAIDKRRKDIYNSGMIGSAQKDRIEAEYAGLVAQLNVLLLHNHNKEKNEQDPQYTAEQKRLAKLILTKMERMLSELKMLNENDLIDSDYVYDAQLKILLFQLSHHELFDLNPRSLDKQLSDLMKEYLQL